MFCAQCGIKLSDVDRFCSKCGQPTSPVPAHAPGSLKSDPSQRLYFGVPENRWWLPFRGKSAFPAGYDWLERRNTLLVCRRHLVLIEGDEKRSAALDIITAMGLVGGVVGAIRNAKDSLLNKKLELTREQAERLFADKLLVWCNKSDAVIWQYHEKPWMFIKSSSEQLYCPFTSTRGTIHACAVLWCTAEGSGQGKPDITSLGCRVVDAGRDIPEKKVTEAMAASRSRLPG